MQSANRIYYYDGEYDESRWIELSDGGDVVTIAIPSSERPLQFSCTFRDLEAVGKGYVLDIASHGDLCAITPRDGQLIVEIQPQSGPALENWRGKLDDFVATLAWLRPSEPRRIYIA